MKPNFNAGGQMTHFVKDDNFNTFRLPVGWQWLINSKTTAGGALNAANWGLYDQLVQACLATGAYCIIDIHNYGRFSK
jgi:endoglucanase